MKLYTLSLLQCPNECDKNVCEGTLIAFAADEGRLKEIEERRGYVTAAIVESEDVLLLPLMQGLLNKVQDKSVYVKTIQHLPVTQLTVKEIESASTCDVSEYTEELMLKVKNVLFEHNLLEGHLVCENCQKSYRIINGIAQFYSKS